MVRTAGTSITGGKSSKSASAKGGSSSSSSSTSSSKGALSAGSNRKSSAGGGNKSVNRPIPTWQAPISKFLNATTPAAAMKCSPTDESGTAQEEGGEGESGTTEEDGDEWAAPGDEYDDDDRSGLLAPPPMEKQAEPKKRYEHVISDTESTTSSQEAEDIAAAALEDDEWASDDGNEEEADEEDEEEEEGENPQACDDFIQYMFGTGSASKKKRKGVVLQLSPQPPVIAEPELQYQQPGYYHIYDSDSEEESSTASYTLPTSEAQHHLPVVPVVTVGSAGTEADWAAPSDQYSGWEPLPDQSLSGWDVPEQTADWAEASWDDSAPQAMLEVDIETEEASIFSMSIPELDLEEEAAAEPPPPPLADGEQPLEPHVVIESPAVDTQDDSVQTEEEPVQMEHSSAQTGDMDVRGAIRHHAGACNH